MSKLLELLGLVSVAVAGLFAAIKSGLVAPRSTTRGVDAEREEDLEEAEEAHGERIEEIEEAAEAVRGASSSELANEFDSAFGAVPKIDPFEPRPDK